MEETKLCPYCDEIIKANAIKCKHCGSVLTSQEVPTGEITPEAQVKTALANRFDIVEEIGRGGMATVYKAVQKNLNRTVALKVIHKNLIHYKEFLERFHREAQLSASLNHHNIVTIFDQGSENGIHYISMEYLEGENLHHIIQQKNRLLIDEAINFIAPIADALNYAHNKGIIHRDIKSSNIIIDENGKPILTDFGIAHAVSVSKLTQSGMVIGTPDYMSPEQAIGGDVDAQSDLYSLGIVLYECITGNLPFKGDTPISTIYKIINNDIEPIRKTVLDAPKWIDSIIKKILAKDKKKRFKNGKEFSAALKYRKEQTGNFQIGSEDETIKISNEDIKKLNEKYHPYKKKKLTFISLIIAIILISGSLIYYFGFFNNEGARGSNWNSLNEFEKKRVELLLAEGDQLFTNVNFVTPPKKNAAEMYTAALKINTGNRHAETQLEKISSKLEDSIKQLIDQNKLDKGKNLLLLSQQYFSSNNSFSKVLPDRIKIKEMEIEARKKLSKDPIEALNLCEQIKVLDPDNSFVKSSMPQIKNNLILSADAEFEKKNFKEALTIYNTLKAKFGDDKNIEQMIIKANSNIAESNKVKIPNLIGSTLENAQRTLGRNGLVKGNVSEIISSEKNKGKVINQIPRAGITVKRGTVINLIVGK